MDKKAIREAIEKAWGDRIFLYFQQYVNPNAVRPQNEHGQEWNDILATLRGISQEEPIKKVNKESNDKGGSSINKGDNGSV